MVGTVIKIAVGVRRLPVDGEGQCAITLSRGFSVKESYAAIVLNFDGELDVWIDGVQMSVEIIDVGFFYSNMTIVHVAEPPFGGMEGSGYGYFFDVFHHQIGEGRTDWRAHRTSKHLFVVMTINLKKVVVQNKLQ